MVVYEIVWKIHMKKSTCTVSFFQTNLIYALRILTKLTLMQEIHFRWFMVSAEQTSAEFFKPVQDTSSVAASQYH